MSTFEFNVSTDFASNGHSIRAAHGSSENCRYSPLFMAAMQKHQIMKQKLEMHPSLLDETCPVQPESPINKPISGLIKLFLPLGLPCKKLLC